MNKGVSLSKGEWFYFLGAGDIFFSDDILMNIFQNEISKQISLIAGNIIYDGNEQAFVYSKKKKIKKVSWNNLMWIRNGLHHQGTFYKKDLFKEITYDLKYQILSDYWFNLLLYKTNKNCKISKRIFAICSSDGVSKNGNWALYQEEIKLKTNLSSMYFTPFFYIIAVSKFLMRKLTHA